MAETSMMRQTSPTATKRPLLLAQIEEREMPETSGGGATRCQPRYQKRRARRQANGEYVARSADNNSPEGLGTGVDNGFNGGGLGQGVVSFWMAL